MAFLITGTDTGVGKTFIAYNLAYALRERGFKAGCLKPVETGVEEVPQDGLLLSRATGQPLEEVVPVRFRLPLAPYAAELEGEGSLSLEKLKEHYEALKKRYSPLLVEGAGGIAVPLKKNYTYGNLAKDWGLKVFVVARAGLGTLNHTFLTCFYARSLGLEVTGIVLNRARGEEPSERTNPRIVEEVTGVRPLVVRDSPSLLLPKEEREALVDYFLSGFKP